MPMPGVALRRSPPRDVMDTILVVNAGSSSVKFQVFAVDGDRALQRQIKGQMDGIGSRPRLRATGATASRWPTRPIRPTSFRMFRLR